MKKVLATAILAVLASTAFADSVSLEGQHVDNTGSNSQTSYILTYKKDLIANKLAADIGFTNTQTEITNALSTRLEAGLTGSANVYGPVGVYTRVAYGEKYTNTLNYPYYSVEPGVTLAVPGVDGLNVKAGWRYRQAVNLNVVDEDTRTGRVSVSYNFTKTDAVALGFDRVSGTSTQNIDRLIYTHSF